MGHLQVVTVRCEAVDRSRGNQDRPTRNVGLAMIRVALDGYEKPVLENPDINAVAEDAAGKYVGSTPPSP
jgi:hypothetical protein